MLILLFGSKVPGDESSCEQKFHLRNFRFSGTKVPWIV